MQSTLNNEYEEDMIKGYEDGCMQLKGRCSLQKCKKIDFTQEELDSPLEQGICWCDPSTLAMLPHRLTLHGEKEKPECDYEVGFFGCI